MTEFTPGPWRFFPENNDWIIRPENKAMAICQASQTFHVSELDAERDANAKLIAEAPAMYEALKKLDGLFGAFDNIPLPAALACRLVETEAKALAILERIDQ